ESLKALLLGGIAFETPKAEAPTQVSLENHVFPLFRDQERAEAASYTRRIEVVSYFPGSVSGLARGSEVTMHGLLVGRVTSVHLAYDAEKDAIVAPVRYEIQPERIVGIGQQVFKTDQEAAEAVINKGLRATLQSANLITGQKEVALDFVSDAPPAPVTMEGEDFVLPTTEDGGFASLASSANDLLGKVNTIPLDQIGKSVAGILKSVNDVTQGPQLKKALNDLSVMIASAQGMIQRLDTKQLPELTAELEKTLTSANKLVLSLDSGYGDNTKFNRDVDRLMAQTTDAVRSLRALADMLARHPEALIKGRPEGPLE
ncbi:MAG: MCE family protein, partial [Hyphomicrobiales bacterium]|nr:MCE family protein [Hyphomicrobiales bacterium]